MPRSATTADSKIPASGRARPRSFVALMGLYESNHIRLGWLAGDLRRSGLAGQGAARRSSVPHDCDLYLSVLELAPYTSTLNLTYLIADESTPGAAPQAIPDMTLRVYHDARLVEALAWSPVHVHAGLRELRCAAERELDQRWARNMMLNKWLDYCLERGHGFSSRG
jgi:uncharacterized protein YqiB (DUF1249 family)